jgi:glycosyltransferase involved in cell wall biosynthesis
MPKLVLNFICKDESHVIERMLNSSKSITDLIVVVDTGSTDNTIELIKRFGENNNIPTYVFQRPFDTFNNSRNHAMQMAKNVVSELDWNPSETWTYWFDCDEQMLVDSNFDKNQFNKDLFMINARIGKMVYTRNTFCRVSKLVDELEWIGPVHEFITSKTQNITSGLAQNLMIDVSMDGASWQGDISKKYLDHAHKLEAYIAADRKDPRWIFYTAQSYHDSASMKDNNEENTERLRRSMKYYKERVKRNDGYAEENYYAQYRIGTIMRILEEPWNLTHMELLKAYSMDPLRGESIKVIIDYYLQIGDWNMAYLYSKFAKSNFHGKNPYPTRLLFVDEAIYIWKFAEAHAASCYYTGRMQEAKETFKEIIEISKKQPQCFSPEDLKKIEMNAQFFLKN